MPDNNNADEMSGADEIRSIEKSSVQVFPCKRGSGPEKVLSIDSAVLDVTQEMKGMVLPVC